jgi:type I restriction enzyme, S subunit
MSLPKYPKYKDSGVEWLGEVPEGWRVIRIKHIVAVPVTDGPHETPEIFDDGIPFISAESIKNNSIDFNLKRGYISETDHQRYSQKFKPKKNDILMIKSGATTGNLGLVDVDQEFNIWSPLAAIRCNQRIAVPKFVFHSMQSPNFKTSIELFWSFGTQQNIGMGVIENLPLCIPSVDDQTAIAAFLDRETGKIDALVSEQEKLIALLKEKRQALISHAVTKGLDPKAKMKDSGVEWLGEVPQGWEVKKLKRLLKIPMQYGANESAEMDDPDLPRFIRITDVNENGSLRDETFRSLPEEIAKPYLLDDGDLLFARSGATSGKTFLYKSTWGRCAYAGYLIRGKFNQSQVVPVFVKYFTSSNNYWQWISSVVIQSTIQNVSADKYNELAIGVPPLTEQTAIAAFLDRETGKIDALMQEADRGIELLKERRSALISAAVTGKIDVRGLATA